MANLLSSLRGDTEEIQQNVQNALNHSKTGYRSQRGKVSERSFSMATMTEATKINNNKERKKK